MKPSFQPLRALAGKLAVLQAEARALGLFANDRELLGCPRCGLLEDVTITGLLITCRPPAVSKIAPKNSRIGPPNRCQSSAIIMPGRGNHVSLSPGERCQAEVRSWVRAGVLHSEAPTGRNMTAQGKERSDAALGLEPKNASSPERANQSGELRGGLGNLSAAALAKVEAHQLFGNDLNRILDELNLSPVP